MQEITIEHIQESYEVGKRYFESKIDRKQGVDNLINAGISPGSSQDILYLYGYYKRGTVFKRTSSALATEYYLNRIHEEEGVSSLNLALSALEQHLIYYEALRGSKQQIKKDILNRYREIISSSNFEYTNPEEITSDESHPEGGVKSVTVNRYERDSKARTKCLTIHGLNCAVCDFNFETNYGSVGEGFIHVHHRVDLATIRSEYNVDPELDLVPVCPNCHAMLHKRRPSYSVEELKEMMNQNNK